MNRLLLLACVLIAALATASTVLAQALPLRPVDGIVAVVEEDVILRSELDRAVATILTQYADRPQQLPPRDVLEKQVLERLVLLRLQLQRAEAAGVRVSDAEVEQTIRRIAQQNNLSLDQLRQQLARDGMAFEEFRETLREELTAQRLRQNVVQSRVTVTDTEVDILLASNSLQRGRAHIAHLLVAVPDNGTQEQIEAARTKIEGVRNLIISGQMDFSTAAIRYSDAPNALDGGDLGWRNFDEIPPMFASLLQGMKPGEVSPAVRGPNGFHMLQLVEASDGSNETVTEYLARHILVRPTEMLDAQAARAKAESLRTRIAAGEDFAQLARDNSDDSLTRAQGGDLGWSQPYAYGEQIGDQLVRLADGELAPVFSTEAGFHVLQRQQSRVQDVTAESQRARAREAIGRRKAEDEYERFLRQLRDESYVELRLQQS
jgi:peptidyl-prolyl cis-trans isomerase SurA